MEPGVPLVHELRDDRVEALHLGHAVVLDRAGNIRLQWGNPDTATHWRSSAKPFQALAFVASGAVDALGLPEEAIALACGSHSTEAHHVDLARRILAAAGLDESALGCGGHPPIADEGMEKPAGGWTGIHNNCSGKHAAMLAACVHHGWPTEGYLERDHPLQRCIRDHLERLTGVKAQDISTGIDGCGAPTFHLSIKPLARAMQLLAAEPAGARILAAMAGHAEMVGGTGRFCTDLPGATGGRIVGKVGAMGLYVALNRHTGEALAVKDTSGARLAIVEAAAAHVAGLAGWLAPDESAKLEAHRVVQLKNWSNAVVGTVLPVVEKP